MSTARRPGPATTHPIDRCRPTAPAAPTDAAVPSTTSAARLRPAARGEQQ